MPTLTTHLLNQSDRPTRPGPYMLVCLANIYIRHFSHCTLRRASFLLFFSFPSLTFSLLSLFDLVRFVIQLDLFVPPSLVLVHDDDVSYMSLRVLSVVVVCWFRCLAGNIFVVV